VNGLVSARTAKEYHLTSNAATESEILRSPVVKAGQLKKSEILKELGEERSNIINISDGFISTGLCGFILQKYF
jgi:hypothetical protein